MSRSTWRPPWRFFVPFVVVHSLVSIWLGGMAFVQGMSRFDTGAEPTPAERAVELLFCLLNPLLPLMVKFRVLLDMLPGLLGHLPGVVSGVLWAFVVWWLVVLTRPFKIRESPGE